MPDLLVVRAKCRERGSEEMETTRNGAFLVVYRCSFYGLCVLKLKTVCSCW
jgi:hypothetical protein